jgi:2-keto-4-pentenoate hydratase
MVGCKVGGKITRHWRDAGRVLQGFEAMANFAERLWWARQQGEVLPPEETIELSSSAEAYAIQAQIVRLSGYEVRGFKVGSTSKEAQRLLGTSEPGSGPILAPYLHMSPAKLAIVPRQTPAVEGEFAFRLGWALPPRKAAYTLADLAMAIDAVAGAIEIVGTRLAGGLAGKGRYLVTADGGANIALITGRWMADWRDLDLKRQSVAMLVNGEVRGRGEGARALGDPMHVMLWLANQQRSGRGLEAGDVVATGTCTGLEAVKPGDAVLADFGRLGSVELLLE